MAMCLGGEVLTRSSVVEEAEPSPPDPPTMKMRSWVVVELGLVVFPAVGQSGGPEKQWEQGQHFSVSPEEEKRSQWPDSG